MDFREFSKAYNDYLAHNFSGTGTKEEFLMHARSKKDPDKDGTTTVLPNGFHRSSENYGNPFKQIASDIGSRLPHPRITGSNKPITGRSNPNQSQYDAKQAQYQQIRQDVANQLDQFIQQYNSVRKEGEKRQKAMDIRRKLPALINQLQKMGEASKRDHTITNALQQIIAANNANDHNQLSQALINARRQLFSNSK